MVTGAAPEFVNEAGQDYRLAAGSVCINAGGNVNPAVLPQHAASLEYVKHRATQPRPADAALDIGAFEFSSGGPVNQPPVASFTAAPTSGIVPVTVSFDAGGSSDPDGSIASYSWEFGDGATGSGVTASHTYNQTGTFTVVLRVTDDSGATSSASRTVTVSPLPAPVLTGSVNGTTVNLTWTDGSGGKATGFRVERRTGSGAWTFVTNVSTTSFSEVRPRARYRYRVRGFNAVATSPWSNIVTLRVN
jgi:PKD repeat protein